MRLEDEEDVRRVLDMYGTMVYRLAYARTGSRADAQDVSQEVFWTLARKNPDFASEEIRRAWLIRVTVNRALSLWRGPWKKRVVLKDEMPKDDPGTEDPPLREALSSLSEKERSLIHLFYFEGYQADEISRILSLSPAAVRKRLSRAREKLKARLTEEE